MSDTRTTLDHAIHAATAEHLDDGEVITRWMVLAATQRFDGGGAVITLVNDEAVPRWQVRGLLAEAMSIVEHDGHDDQPEE